MFDRKIEKFVNFKMTKYIDKFDWWQKCVQLFCYNDKKIEIQKCMNIKDCVYNLHFY